MLILSRRQNERVNFPSLGITVEVLRTGTKKVQLGIDAPSEIRIVRDELAWRENRPAPIELTQTDAESIRNELQSVTMAIRLSQNQIRQGLDNHAEAVLDDAIQSLRRIEERIDSMESSQPDTNELVREPAAKYSVATAVTVNCVVQDWFQDNFMP